MTNLTGGISKIDKTAECRTAISKSILQEIFHTIEFHFKDTIETLEKKKKKDLKKSKKLIKKMNDNWKQLVRTTVNKKLSALNRHFTALKNDQLDKNISEEDKFKFQDYDEYAANLFKFNDLDEKRRTIGKEINKIELVKDINKDNQKFKDDNQNKSDKKRLL